MSVTCCTRAVGDAFAWLFTGVTAADDGRVVGVDRGGDAVVKDIAASFEGAAICLVTILYDAAVELIDALEAFGEKIGSRLLTFDVTRTYRNYLFVFIFLDLGQLARQVTEIVDVEGDGAFHTSQVRLIVGPYVKYYDVILLSHRLKLRGADVLPRPLIRLDMRHAHIYDLTLEPDMHLLEGMVMVRVYLKLHLGKARVGVKVVHVGLTCFLCARHGAVEPFRRYYDTATQPELEAVAVVLLTKASRLLEGRIVVVEKYSVWFICHHSLGCPLHR